MLKTAFPDVPLIPGYRHIDCIFGKHAAIDVFYPVIQKYLDAHGRSLTGST
ncbi:MAG: hypothetical protein CPDRYMAC_2937 [uncultured Paraburkholderia sp.]|nr:MAG: hypothetical protein CPDRYDRY_5797 [uncultured Paraburkholderia sp.]CAH2927860.1 MAG: hypothetical protein CPDRYMAC_2937 [uncultured Paraburkholderia sp.]